MGFFDVSFWQNVVSGAAATLIGAGLGVLSAFWIDRRITQHRIKERRTQLLGILSETLQENRGIAQRLLGHAAPGVAIFYNFDISLLESTASLKYEVISNLTLNKELDSIRNALRLLHGKVELQLEIAYSTFRAIGSYAQIRGQLMDSIAQQVPPLIAQIDRVTELIQQELDS